MAGLTSRKVRERIVQACVGSFEGVPKKDFDHLPQREITII
jgi:hypothetical protein